MKKDLKKDEKIQTKIADKAESQTLQECCEQNSKEKFDESAWRSRALEFLELIFDNKETTLILYQYSRLVEDKWSPFVPYSSYVHFTVSKPDLKSIILGSLENLEIGHYRFKLLSIFKYDKFWEQCFFGPVNDLEQYPLLELNVFEQNGVKGFEVLNCFNQEELFKK